MKQLKDEISGQIKNLTIQIDTTPTSEKYFERGKLYWKAGEKGAAITDFNRALDLDPESPAKAYLEMANEIMDFYNTDLYNP